MSESDAIKSNILATIQYSINPNDITYRVNQALREFGTLNFIIPYYQNPNIPTRFTTPLIAAVVRGDPDLVQYLLENGADPNYAPGQVIGSPLDYALNSRNDLIADILVRAGGKPIRALSSHPSESRYREQFLAYRPSGSGYQQAQTRFYQGSEYYRGF